MQPSQRLQVATFGNLERRVVREWAADGKAVLENFNLTYS